MQITELRPGTSIKQISTKRMGVTVAPPPGKSVKLGWTWVDLGKGLEEIKDDAIDVNLRHIRLTVRHNPQDFADDLKQVARLRRDLQVHSHVEVDLDNPYSQTGRDETRNVYFDFPTEYPDEVRRVLRKCGHEGRVTMQDFGEVGLVCARCGFIAGYVAKCPNCGLRDIDPCLHCGHVVARECYVHFGHELFTCPDCGRRVRFEFNPDLQKADGSFRENEPVVLVHDGEGLTNHALRQ